VIGISVGDILKVLDQIPVWKTVAGLPKRMAALEAEVAALKEQANAKPLAKPTPAALVCPFDGETMKVMQERNHPEFGFAGLKVHIVECPSCNHRFDRMFDPRKGYST